MTDEQIDALAREAYRAYGATTDFKNFQGNPMPAFDDLPPKIREAWGAASQAAHAWRPPPPVTKWDGEPLIYAAYDRCTCGAGMAYPNAKPGEPLPRSWGCSAILLGQAQDGPEHVEPRPFAFYEIKSERQPSANGATTRPVPLP
jgi:hypothetical protein